MKQKYMLNSSHLYRCASLLAITMIFGCTSPITMVGEAALEMVGLKKPEVPDEKKPARAIRLQLQAGKNLNADDKGRAQAAVVKIYHLKEANSFWLAPYETFIHPERESAALGANLLAVQEVTLAPGQNYDVVDKVPGVAKYVGIVTLFYSPAPQRWRVVFDAEKSQKEGILLGIHACAMTATRGSTVASQAPGQAALPQPQWNSLLSVTCPTPK